MQKIAFSDIVKKLEDTCTLFLHPAVYQQNSVLRTVLYNLGTKHRLTERQFEKLPYYLTALELCFYVHLMQSMAQSRKAVSKNGYVYYVDYRLLLQWLGTVLNFTPTLYDLVDGACLTTGIFSDTDADIKTAFYNFKKQVVISEADKKLLSTFCTLCLEMEQEVKDLPAGMYSIYGAYVNPRKCAFFNVYDKEIKSFLVRNLTTCLNKEGK